MKSSTRIAFIILAAVGFGAIVVLATLLLRPYSYHGMTFQSSQPAKDFILTGPDGRPVSLSDYRGKLVALYFGYTFCPDVCPTTLAELGQAVKQLGPKAEEIQVLMVTVDPERDTPERLAEYVSYFNPAFVGLTGTPDQIAAAATPFGIYYEKHEGTPATGYLVDHTATISVLDRAGRLALVWPFGIQANDIAADLKHLLN